MKYKITLTALALLCSSSVMAQGCPGSMTYDTDASVFTSATTGDGVTLFPIGGSGIGNGSFAVCDDPGVQIAGRITERFVGPITPDAGTADYHAPIGDATPPGNPGEAKWNIEGHIDFGYAIGGGVAPDELADVILTAQYDCDPHIDVIDGPTLPLGLLPGTAVLIQFSQNLGFAGACPNFDPTVDGHYAFIGAVSDLNGVLLAHVQVNAIVGNPVNAPKISAEGTIESQIGGFKFPDGTVQTTAAVSGPPPSAFPATYINSANTDFAPGAELAFVGCDAGDTIVGGGGRCRGQTGLFPVDIMHKSCPANAAGACLDAGGTNFETWAVQCEGNSRSFAYAVCLDMTP